MSDISELLEKIKVATGPDREIDGAVFAACGYPVNPKNSEYVKYPDASETTYSLSPPLSASIDAALALVERKLPEAQVGLDPIFFVGYAVGSESVEWDAIICIPHWDRWNPVNSEWIERIEARHKDKRLAILAALLSALEAQP